MHLGNGAITPECVALTYSAAAVGLAASAAGIRRAGLTQEKLTTAAGLGCVVFAAQAINVTILPGTSAHFVGGVLLASLLGPGLGAWTMALVLLVQALLLGDGGMAALGANALNMALLPAGMVWATRWLASPATMGIAAGCAVPLAALLIVAEAAAFRPAAELTGWTSFATLMVGTHAWIGMLEGVTTALLVAALQPRVALQPVWRLSLVGIATGLFLMAITLPISSPLPDAYEAAAQSSGMDWLLAP
jgi:cobalt/nickel transport system permease protein